MPRHARCSYRNATGTAFRAMNPVTQRQDGFGRPGGRGRCAAPLRTRSPDAEASVLFAPVRSRALVSPHAATALRGRLEALSAVALDQLLRVCHDGLRSMARWRLDGRAWLRFAWRTRTPP